MTITLTEQEVRYIIEGLRMNEKQSRRSFAMRLANNNCISQELGDKVERANQVFTEIADLRRRLGDDKPVTPFNARR